MINSDIKKKSLSRRMRLPKKNMIKKNYFSMLCWLYIKYIACRRRRDYSSISSTVKFCDRNLEKKSMVNFKRKNWSDLETEKNLNKN